MTQARDFADAIGRKKMAEALGVGLTAVSNAVVRNAFPASWFQTCLGLASEAGVEFPAHLFGQRGSSEFLRGDTNGEVQGGAQ